VLIAATTGFARPTAAQAPTPLREFFTDTFGDPLDFNDYTDMPLVDEGPTEGIVPGTGGFSNGIFSVAFDRPGYFSPLWGGYDTGGRSDGSDAIGHRREGSAFPVDGRFYTNLRVRLATNLPADLALVLYTCPQGVRPECETVALKARTEPRDFAIYEATLPRAQVTGIRIAISPIDERPVTVNTDFVGVFSEVPGNVGPVPLVLNPDAAGAIPQVFYRNGKALPFRSQSCPDREWASSVRQNPWDMGAKNDLASVSGYEPWSIDPRGWFSGIALPSVRPGVPGDPGIVLSQRDAAGRLLRIDPSIYHRLTVQVTTWSGRYSQSYAPGGDGGWVFRALWKFRSRAGAENGWQVSLPAVTYPHGYTWSLDLDDPTPFDDVEPPPLNVNETRNVRTKQLGWSRPARLIDVFRIDLAEPLRPRQISLDDVWLAPDDCGRTGAEILVYNFDRSNAPAKVTVFASPSRRGPWTEITRATYDAADHATGRKSIVWSNAPPGRWWIKVAMERDGVGGEHVSTGPVVIDPTLSKAVSPL
jgi:hypothetical protein